MPAKLSTSNNSNRAFVLSKGVSIADALTQAKNYLAILECNPHIDAGVDAKALLSHVTGHNQTYFYTWPEKQLSENDIQAYVLLVNKRSKGEPVAYLTGERGFWTLNLKTDNSTLIPRADTECMVEHVLTLLAQTRAKILDLGTGTGAIALALASENPKWQVYGCDYNEQAVALAQQNAQLCAPQLGGAQVEFVKSNWFEYFAAKQIGQFDLIISNPPYIAQDDHHLSEGDVAFEPRSALVANNDGYQDIYHIIDNAKRFLKSGGILMIEHGFEQGQQVRCYFEQQGFYKVETRQDYAQNDRFTYGYA